MPGVGSGGVGAMKLHRAELYFIVMCPVKAVGVIVNESASTLRLFERKMKNDASFSS